MLTLKGETFAGRNFCEFATILLAVQQEKKTFILQNAKVSLGESF